MGFPICDFSDAGGKFQGELWEVIGHCWDGQITFDNEWRPPSLSFH